MKLITEALQKKFEKYPIGSQEGMLGNSKVIAKFFNSTGKGIWLIMEGSKLEDGDYEMFGYCHLGDDMMAEFGYVYLSQLEEMNSLYGLQIEQDMELPENCNIIQAMKQNGINPPSFLIEEIEDEEI